MPERDPLFPGDMTLDEAREVLRPLVEKGHKCPLCTRKVKIYPRPLPAASARVLIRLFRLNEGRDFVKLGPILDTMKGTAAQGGYGTLAHHWGLMEAMPGKREDGSNRVGWWRLTDLGRAFVRGEATVPKRARIFANRLLGYVGPPWTISDALREPFDFNDLMNYRGDA